MDHYDIFFYALAAFALVGVGWHWAYDLSRYRAQDAAGKLRREWVTKGGR